MAPYVGEIKMFGGNFYPAGWMWCDGRELPISEFETLFNLIGTTYGGDGQSTFRVPDLCGRIPIHMGQGPGLSESHTLGEKGGVPQVTLTTQQIPVHSHNLVGSTSNGNTPNPSTDLPDEWENRGLWAASGHRPFTVDDGSGRTMNSNVMAQPAGGNQPHENMQPWLCVNFIISLFGVFPSQT